MKFLHASLSFEMVEGEQLSKLCNERGYSKPTKEAPYARRLLTDEAYIEVRRTGKTSLQVVCFAGAQGSIVSLICYAVHDLAECGLITKGYQP